MTLGELCEKYKQTLDERNRTIRKANELSHKLAELRDKITTETVEMVYKMCAKQLVSGSDDEKKKKLEVWIGEALYTLLSELETIPAEYWCKIKNTVLFYVSKTLNS